MQNEQVAAQTTATIDSPKPKSQDTRDQKLLPAAPLPNRTEAVPASPEATLVAVTSAKASAFCPGDTFPPLVDFRQELLNIINSPKPESLEELPSKRILEAYMRLFFLHVYETEAWV